jgi:nicotinamidase-related amidase
MPQPDKHPDLHGNVPDDGAVALLLIDVLNPLDFEGHESFVPKALQVAPRILALRERATRHGVPVVYVNDNVGRWQSDARHVLDTVTAPAAPGHEIARLLAPRAEDYVVLKPKHSGFYATPLDTLLTYLRAERLVLAGLTVERCVLFTANDAFLRDYDLFVPRDCTVAITDEDYGAALRILESVLAADTRPSGELDLSALNQPQRRSSSR